LHASPPTDWQHVFTDERRPTAVVDSRRRMRLLLAGLVLLVTAVLARAVALEVTHGDAFRRDAIRTIHRERILPARRGRIVAHDGTVLTEDRAVLQLTVAYRALQLPPNAGWLRSQAIRRLDANQRRDSERIETETAVVRRQLDAMHQQLPKLAGVTPAEWDERRRDTVRRVERIADLVNRHRLGDYQAQRDSRDQTTDDTEHRSWLARAVRWLSETFPPPDALPPPAIVVAEEQQQHVLVPNLSPEAAEAVQTWLSGDPLRESLVQLTNTTQRIYPHGALAAHVLGHVGPTTGEAPTIDGASLWEGRLGVELRFDTRLRGHPGLERRRINRHGDVLQTLVDRRPQSGSDLHLTLDVRLQQTAEDLLDSALARRPTARTSRTTQGESKSADESPSGLQSPGGGAIVVMDCDSGELRVVASAPTFDPNMFTRRDNGAIESALQDPAGPLLNRVTQMAVPPGSVMKLITAVALLEEGTTTPTEPFVCQGYLDSPERLRCAIYRQRGHGHDELTLPGALARSCNVYFFYHAPRMGPRALVTWADRFGLGRTTGVDLPDEAAGRLPTPDWLGEQFARGWRNSDTQMLAIGQGALTTTPLQISRATAAIANGGYLVRPHVTNDTSSSAKSAAGAVRIVNLHQETLRVVRRGMRQAVGDPEGTMHSYLVMDDVAVAAKTGTAQTGTDATGEERADHAWLVGYLPADEPRYVFVIALEHAGNADAATGPVARRLVRRMQELGYCGPAQLAARPINKTATADARG